jgi:DNA-binding XRE family transcriptional regulator
MFDNLEAEQKRHRLTNATIAEKIGISRVSYEAKKKNGKFKRREIVALCLLFGKTFEYLFDTATQKSA